MKICRTCKLTQVIALIIVVAVMSVPSSVEAASKIRLFVANAANDENLFQLSEIAANNLTGALAKSGVLEVAERNELELIKREQKINASQLQNPETAAKIGKIMSCRYAVLSSLVYETSPVISVRIVEITTSKIVFSDTDMADASDDSSVIAASSRLADKILEVLAGEQAVITGLRAEEAVINRGSTSGVRVGDLYRVYIGTKRNSVNMAIIRVKDVRADFSTAETVKNGGNIATLRRADKIEAVSKTEADSLIRRRKLAKKRPNEKEGRQLIYSSVLKVVDPIWIAMAEAGIFDVALLAYQVSEDKDNPEMYYSFGQSFLKIGENARKKRDPNFFASVEKMLNEFGVSRIGVSRINNEWFDLCDGVMKKCFSMAMHFFTLDAENGKARSQNSLGYMYLEGVGVKKDYGKAMEFFTKAAEKGHRTARYNIGYMYYNGFGVKRDYNKALEWYRKAAEKGHAKALNSLGSMYENGRGVKQDYAKALEYYTKAADKGNTVAMRNLGNTYNKGLLGLKQNYAKAAEWYCKAADKGDSTSQFNLGQMYEKGLGVRQDVRKAIELYRKAALQGNESARNSLKALGVNVNLDNIKYDYTKFVELITKLADKGDVGAMHMAGLMYCYGFFGEKQNYTKAAKWYRKAADKGNANAQFQLGQMYEQGLGFRQDTKKAKELYRKAAANGDKDAAKRLKELGVK